MTEVLDVEQSSSEVVWYFNSVVHKSYSPSYWQLTNTVLYLSRVVSLSSRLMIARTLLSSGSTTVLVLRLSKSSINSNSVFLWISLGIVLLLDFVALCLLYYFYPTLLSARCLPGVLCYLFRSRLVRVIVRFFQDFWVLLLRFFGKRLRLNRFALCMSFASISANSTRLRLFERNERNGANTVLCVCGSFLLLSVPGPERAFLCSTTALDN